MRYGYTRVSTTDQNTDRQELPDIDQLHEEHASAGTITGRGVLTHLLQTLSRGDTLVVYSIDRLARSLLDLATIVQDLTARGVRVEILKEQMVFDGSAVEPAQMLMLHILGAFAQFERSIIRSRISEGFAAAKARGKTFGPKRSWDLEAARARAASGESYASIARSLGISQSACRLGIARSGGLYKASTTT